MTITTLNPHDATNKTSITHALKAGYRITLDADGCAEVISPKGQAYHITDWECDCPDSLGRRGGNYELPDKRRVCKHVLMIAQIYPCQCEAIMVLNTQAGWKIFQCTLCGRIKAACAVKTERQQIYRQREQNAATADRVINVPEPPDPSDAQSARDIHSAHAQHASRAIFAH